MKLARLLALAAAIALFLCADRIEGLATDLARWATGRGQ
jgi:hypothetical protein